MSSLEQHHSALLQKCLTDEFIPHLPPLLDNTKPGEERSRKNLSRAFSAFAIHHICGVPKADAAASVIDDFDDYGVDAIYYHAPTETLYLVQSKLKATEEFKQDEALAFCQGIKKLIKQDFKGFNINVQNRITEIEDALDNCSQIQLVLAHTGTGITKHAKGAIDELLADDGHGEQRLQKQAINYDAMRVLQDLRAAKAYEKVDVDLWIQKWSFVAEPRVTYFGLIPLEDLVHLHNDYGKALYEKNIRTFLGHHTDVNASIQKTLATVPEEFLYFNNGVTALCQGIEPKSDKGGRKKLRIRGFTVINGAQTIATSAKFIADNTTADVSKARVSLTLINADLDGQFGKFVTRARNHQNPVQLSNFAALDDEQERLRRDIAHLGIRYAYKAEGPDTTNEANRIRIDEAAQALSMLQQDPRYVVWLKKEPTRLLDTSSDQYKGLFGKNVTAFQLVNAVRFNRCVQKWMEAVALAASGQERLVYKHGTYAMAWVLSKRMLTAICSPILIEECKLAAALSVPFDELRQILWERTKAATLITEGPPPEYFRGPLAIFRNQTDVVPLLQEVAIENFGLTKDPVVEHKKTAATSGTAVPRSSICLSDFEGPTDRKHVMNKKQKLELTWIGKENRPKLEPRILMEDREKSYHATHRVTDHDLFDNRLIFGDNLLALKALEEEFAGKIKCIYIDPPYNTGAAFTHFDDGIEHSLWLSLIKARLEILWRLLSADGSLWISIDDYEMPYLRVVLDELCGRASFIAANVWQKRYSRENREAIGDVHEYVLLYAKSPDTFKETRNLLPLTEEQRKIYKNPNRDPKGPWRTIPITAQAGHATKSQFYRIVAPGGKTFDPPPGNCWRYTQEVFEKLKAQGRIYFGKDNNSQPNTVRYLSEVKGSVPWTWWPHDEVGNTDEAKKEMLALFKKEELFETPKPERLLHRILTIATNKGDLILDSFAGSGTTGAVAQKMGRRWIMVELGEHCHSHVIPRLKKVIDGEDKGGITNAVGWKGGGGFRYYHLAPSLLEKDKWGNWIINKIYNPAMLAQAVCKLEGFIYAPSDAVYWQQGYSTERDFIYVTTQNLSHDQLQALSDDVGEERSLLVLCPAFRGKADKYPNLTINKIPKAVLTRCEWGHDDYSLRIENLPKAPIPQGQMDLLGGESNL